VEKTHPRACSTLRSVRKSEERIPIIVLGKNARLRTRYNRIASCVRVYNFYTSICFGYYVTRATMQAVAFVPGRSISRFARQSRDDELSRALIKYSLSSRDFSFSSFSMKDLSDFVLHQRLLGVTRIFEIPLWLIDRPFSALSSCRTMGVDKEKVSYLRIYLSVTRSRRRSGLHRTAFHRVALLLSLETE